jgi:hypothetical protein
MLREGFYQYSTIYDWVKATLIDEIGLEYPVRLHDGVRERNGLIIGCGKFPEFELDLEFESTLVFVVLYILP